jgi:hypothetical protein
VFTANKRVATPFITAVPTLKKIQNAIYRAKKKKVVGIQISTKLELTQFCERMLLPPASTCRQLVTNPTAEAVTAFMGRDCICIPQDAAAFSVEGACFTGPTQIKWIEQLLKHDNHFCLHMDGKYKLHHGVWILLTLGTHHLKVVGETKVSKLHTSFVPLIYLFCRNHESTGESTSIRTSTSKPARMITTINFLALLHFIIHTTTPIWSVHHHPNAMPPPYYNNHLLQVRRRCCRRH